MLPIYSPKKRIMSTLIAIKKPTATLLFRLSLAFKILNDPMNHPKRAERKKNPPYTKKYAIRESAVNAPLSMINFASTYTKYVQNPHPLRAYSLSGATLEHVNK